MMESNGLKNNVIIVPLKILMKIVKYFVSQKLPVEEKDTIGTPSPSNVGSQNKAKENKKKVSL